MTRQSILVVDDDPIILKLVGKVLSTQYEIFLCTNGKDALATCKNNPHISLAMYDVDMPGINGIETAKTIWEHFHIPFIIFSQFNNAVILNEAIRIGALHYLVKPLNFDEIIPAVKTALERAQDINNLKQDSDRAMDLANTLNENRKILNKVITEEEQYRKDIVKELHDEIGQTILLMNFHLKHITNANNDQNVEITKHTIEMQSIVKSLHAEIKSIILRLRPEVLDALELGEAVKYFLNVWQQNHPEIIIDDKKCDASVQASSPIDAIIYRGLQEAFTNLEKYSSATTVRVAIELIPGFIQLSVKDNGIGFDTNTTPLGIGLSSIREKVLSVGGQFKLTAYPNKGVTIKISLPLP